MSDNYNKKMPPIPPAREVGRKRQVDETTLSPEEARKLEIRRAYNRQCAAQARIRNKERIAALEARIDELMKENSNLRGVIEHMTTQIESLTRENRALVLQQLLQNGTLPNVPTLGQASAGASLIPGANMEGSLHDTGNGRSALSLSSQNDVSSRPIFGQAFERAGLYTGAGAGAGDSVRNIGSARLPASLPNQSSTGSQMSLGLLNLLVSQNPALASQLLEAANAGLSGSATSITNSADASAHGANGLYGTYKDSKTSGNDHFDSRNNVNNSDKGGS